MVIAGGILLVAARSSNVGQSGAPGYLAIGVLYGIASPILKPTALFLAIIVSVIATIRSYRSGNFRWRTFWPFALASMPAAAFAAAVPIRPIFYLSIVSLLLIYAAFELFFAFHLVYERKRLVVPNWIVFPAGTVFGLIAGSAGIGGAILLSRLLLLTRRANPEEAIAVAGPFALLNSILAFGFSGPTMPLMFADLAYWAPAALIGASIGAEAQVGPLVVILNRVLSVIFIIAALKLIFEII